MNKNDLTDDEFDFTVCGISLFPEDLREKEIEMKKYELIDDEFEFLLCSICLFENIVDEDII